MTTRTSISRFILLLLYLFSCNIIIGCRADDEIEAFEAPRDEFMEIAVNVTADNDNDDANNATAADDDDDAWWEDDAVGVHGERATYIVPKVAAFLSLLGSGAIVAEVWVEHQKHSRRSSPSIGYLLISTSISDILSSAAYFVGNWAVPSDTPYVWNAKGNTASCDAQGFFVQLGWAATPLFSLALSIYFLLIVRYGWKETRLRKLDPWIHGSIWLLSLIMAIIPIPLELYNDSYGLCWVEPKPYGCSPVDDDWPCTRGHQAAEWALAYYIFPSLVCLALSTIVMGMLYQTVRQMETDRMSNVIRNGSQEFQLNSVDRKRSRKVGMQAMLYLAVYYLVMVPQLITYVFSYINEDWYNYWSDLIAYGILLPMLGFFNFLVFASRRDQMYTCFGQFLSRALCCFGVTGVVLRQSTLYLSRLSTGITLSSRMPSSRVPSSRMVHDDTTNNAGGDDITDNPGGDDSARPSSEKDQITTADHSSFLQNK